MSGRASFLETERLLLRRARADDLDDIHRIMSDAETMCYWSTLPHATVDQSRAWLASMIAAEPATSDDFVIEHAGRVVGKLGAWRLPEIGFFIDRNHWGRGFASEALAAFIAYMATRRLPCLTADVDPLNARSLVLLKRAGFVETGRASATFILGDRVCDSVFLKRDLV